MYVKSISVVKFLTHVPTCSRKRVALIFPNSTSQLCHSKFLMKLRAFFLTNNGHQLPLRFVTLSEKLFRRSKKISHFFTVTRKKSYLFPSTVYKRKILFFFLMVGSLFRDNKILLSCFSVSTKKSLCF